MKDSSAKVRKQYVKEVVEECLTKRPYAKHLVLCIAEGGLKSETDLPRIARECLKHLTSEDFMQMAHAVPDKMADYERRFANIEG